MTDKMFTGTLSLNKTKPKYLESRGILISTMQLICAFVFAYEKSRFSHDAAKNMLWMPY